MNGGTVDQLPVRSTVRVPVEVSALENRKMTITMTPTTMSSKMTTTMDLQTKRTIIDHPNKTLNIMIRFPSKAKAAAREKEQSKKAPRVTIAQSIITSMNTSMRFILKTKSLTTSLIKSTITERVHGEEKAKAENQRKVPRVARSPRFARIHPVRSSIEHVFCSCSTLPPVDSSFLTNHCTLQYS
jgi:hypothetical protein